MTVICHLGYPRAGSTAIQRALRKSKDVNYFDYTSHPTMKYIFYILVPNARNSYFKQCAAVAKNLIKEYLDSFDDKKQTVISFENLLAFPPNLRVDVDVAAQRIKYLLGDDVDFLVVLRNQKKMLKSIYKINLVEGLDCSYAEYLEYLALRAEESFLSLLNYTEIVDEISKAGETSFYFLEDMKKPDVQAEFLQKMGVADLTRLPRVHSSTDFDRSAIKTGIYQGAGFSSKRFDVERLSYYASFMDATKLFEATAYQVIHANEVMHENRKLVLGEHGPELSTEGVDAEIASVAGAEIELYMDKLFAGWNRTFSERHGVDLSARGYIV